VGFSSDDSEYRPRIKTYENYSSRAIETNTTVLLAGASNDENPEVVALKDQITEMTVTEC
jgi:hypothetical protein